MKKNHLVCGLNKELICQIVKLILEQKQPEKVVIFGSRAEGSFKHNSDIDIAIFGKDWTSSDVNMVKFNLEEKVKTPLKFDVLNFYNIGKVSLKENILKKGRIVYGPEKS